MSSQRHRFTSIVTLAVVLASTALVEADSMSSNEPSATLVSHYTVNYERQEAPLLTVPMTTSSSYDYWWPYPPGGVATSTSTTLALVTPLTSLISSILTDSDLPSSTILLSSSVQSDITSSTSSDTDSQSSSITSFSIVHISALPPANTTAAPATLHKLKPSSSSSFKIIYLAPVFAILGLGLGSASAWFCYGFFCTRRGPRTRASSLEPGPPYSSGWPPSEYKLQHGVESENEKDETDRLCVEEDGSSSEKRSSYRSKSPRSGRSSRASMSFSQNPASTSRTTDREREFLWPAPTPMGYEHEDNDPFLNVPSRGPSTRSGRLTSVYSPCASVDSLSLVELEDDEDYDEALHHHPSQRKSIGRGILERLKLGTLRRARAIPLPETSLERGESMTVQIDKTRSSSLRRSSRRGHYRTDSDVLLSEVKRPERSYTSAEASKRERDVFRGAKMETAVDETQWVPGSGFRIIEEHLEAITQQIRKNDWGCVREADSIAAGRQPKSLMSERGYSWASAASDEEDKFTALPVRKSPTKSGRSPGVSRTTTSASIFTQKGIARVDSSVLPLSPPQLTSPPLESKLFFTPTLHHTASSSTSNPWEALSRPFASSPTYTAAPTRGTTGSTANARKGNKLHSPTPPRLPFPSSSDSSPYRNRLVKPHSSEKSLPVTPPRRTNVSTQSSSSERYGSDKRGTPAQRYEARKRALDKVEEIVSRSRSHRVTSEESMPFN